MEGSSVIKKKKIEIIMYLPFVFRDFTCFVGSIVVYYHFVWTLVERV